jgi:hypothetical protein
VTRRSEIRLERPFGTDDLSDAVAVGLPSTPRPTGDGPQFRGCPSHPQPKLTEPFMSLN